MSEARAYVEAWFARAPAMELARGFAAPAQRELFGAWGALLEQLDEAAFELSEPHVARTKLAWWGDELATMAGGTSRHPLARVLGAHTTARAVPAPDWHALVHAAVLAGDREHPAPGDIDGLLGASAPYARLTARIEAMLFESRFGAAATPPSGGPVAVVSPAVDALRDAGAESAVPPDAAPVARPAAEPAGALAVSVHHAVRRLEHALGRDASQYPWPLDLRARHQATPEQIADFTAAPAGAALVADLAGRLERARTAGEGGTLFRRTQSVLDGARLRALAARRFGRERALGPALAWRLWRAARRAG